MALEFYKKLPDDVVVVSEFNIINFIDQGGKSCYALEPKGNISTVALLGALELVKFNLLIFNQVDDL